MNWFSYCIVSKYPAPSAVQTAAETVNKGTNPLFFVGGRKVKKLSKKTYLRDTDAEIQGQGLKPRHGVWYAEGRQTLSLGKEREVSREDVEKTQSDKHVVWLGPHKTERDSGHSATAPVPREIRKQTLKWSLSAGSICSLAGKGTPGGQTLPTTGKDQAL